MNSHASFGKLPHSRKEREEFLLMVVELIAVTFACGAYVFVLGFY